MRLSFGQAHDQAVAQFVVDDRHHVLTMARLPRPVHHQEIPVQDAGPVHGVAGDPHLEGRRRVADPQLAYL